jgi:hypothetical protein
MANLQPRCQVILEDPSAKYGHVESRAYAYTARASDKEADKWELQNLRRNSDAGFVILEPVYAPEDNALTEWTLSGTYSGGTTTFGTTTHVETGKNVIFTYVAGSVATWSGVKATCAPKWWVDICLPAIPPGTVYANDNAYIEYPSAGTNRYRVVIANKQSIRLDYTQDSGTTYKTVSTEPSANLSAFGNWARILFMSVGQNVLWAVNNGPWNLHNNPNATSFLTDDGALTIAGTGQGAAFAANQLYYHPQGTLYGPRVNLPQYTTGTPVGTCSGTSSSGESISIEAIQEDADSFFYEVGMSAGTTSNGYATTTPILTDVRVTYKPSFKVNPAPVQATLEHIQAVEETVYFDPSTLNIYTQAVITCDNAHGDFAYWSGVRSCSLELGYAGEPYYRRLTGLCGHLMEWNTGVPHKTFRIHAYDRSVMLRAPGGVIVSNLPYMDGWCVYRALRYLANYGGITDDWLKFPLCEGDIDNPCGHYLLPYGDYFHPLMRFTGGQYVWDCMQRVQQYVGYVLFFDPLGYLQFYQWIPETPGPFKKSFTLIAAEDASGMPQRNEMLHVSRTRDLRTVRNDVTIIGIDPNTFLPIVAHDRDNDSIYNPYAANYLGYRSSMVWADSMFCTTEYAEQALNSIFNAARLPNDTVSFVGWAQPELYPMDVISAFDPRTAPGYQPYWITSITNRYVIGDDLSKMPLCEIQAQWLTPWG